MFYLHLTSVGNKSKFDSLWSTPPTVQQHLSTARVGETRAEAMEGQKADASMVRETW